MSHVCSMLETSVNMKETLMNKIQNLSIEDYAAYTLQQDEAKALLLTHPEHAHIAEADILKVQTFAGLAGTMVLALVEMDAMTDPETMTREKFSLLFSLDKPLANPLVSPWPAEGEIEEYLPEAAALLFARILAPRIILEG